MKEKNMFSNIEIPENPNQESPKKPVESPFSRRSLLKAGLAVAVLYGAGNFKKEWLDYFKDNEGGEDNECLTDEEIANRLENLPKRGPSAGQTEIEEYDQTMVGDTIREQLEKGEKIKLDMSTKKALYTKWEQSYGKRPADCPDEDKLTGRNHLGLLQSMERMQPWIEAMKAEFREVGVPEKFVYLTIPESHFDFDANSRASAGGPYQFTAGTAKGYGLDINRRIDERRDPIKSARACAEHLKYSYERFNNDWDLAFSDYNGGFTNEYEKFRTEKEDRNYQDYLAWREGRLNEFVSRDSYEHKVVEGDDNLAKVADYYKLSVKELSDLNGLVNNQIKIGQTLKLPPTIPVKLFKLRDSLENLNYPEKFYAVLDVIEKEDLGRRFPSSPLKFKLKEIPKIPVSEFLHTVEHREGLFGIAREINAIFKESKSKVELSSLEIQKMIQRQNGIENPKTIRKGQKLKVELPLDSGTSLGRIARENKIPVDKLAELNPAVIDAETELPAGTKIRIPR